MTPRPAQPADAAAVDRPRRGRPRDEELTGRLLHGALDLVAEQGLGRLNADALVARTGSGRSGLYRRWSDMSSLVADALVQQPLVPAPADTGSLRGDLLALFEPWRHPLTAAEQTAAALLGPAGHDAALRSALDEAVVEPLAAVVAAVVEQEARRGRPVPADRQRLVGVVVQALWWERYVTGRPGSTEAEVAQIVDRAVLPLLVDG
ncbi:TetR/AcrR family transcriptional regulator [Klenkia brasiliensis]|uniref:Transcriptional regulator, TetR family n=1 Tax=Klenkia brasiliensis TaxID=333142 RepID=A0A1G7XZS7_9ACTN|nr:TetR/AcrR family transcriptional regulator [Klenkia brasiliensis]SDG89613.1 transcriptional regulator, TetR family [Klenkia brasiliensis]